MSKIGLWSTTAASNNSTPPDGWPEGQAPSTVNDCAREMMAAIRTFAQDGQWFDHGLTPTYTGVNTFTVPGNQTAYLMEGRQLKLYDGASIIYRSIATAVFGAATTVTLDAGTNITISLSSFAIGILTNTNGALPRRFSTSSVEVTALSAASLVVSGTIRGKNGSVAAPSVIFDGTDVDTGLAWGGDGLVNTVTNGVVGMVVSTGGAVAESYMLGRTDGDTGLQWVSDGIFRAMINNVEVWRQSATALLMPNTGNLKTGVGSELLPAITFSTADPDSGAYWVSDGVLGWSCNGVQAGRLLGTGYVSVAYNVTSDAVTKKDWTLLGTDFVSRLSEIKAGSYTKIKDNTRAIGVPAQDLEKLLPEAVIMVEGVKLANYGPAAMIATIALAKRAEEQADLIDRLIERIETLENKK